MTDLDEASAEKLCDLFLSKYVLRMICCLCFRRSLQYFSQLKPRSEIFQTRPLAVLAWEVKASPSMASTIFAFNPSAWSCAKTWSGATSPGSIPGLCLLKPKRIRMFSTGLPKKLLHQNACHIKMLECKRPASLLQPSFA